MPPKTSLSRLGRTDFRTQTLPFNRQSGSIASTSKLTCDFASSFLSHNFLLRCILVCILHLSASPLFTRSSSSMMDVSEDPAGQVPFIADLVDSPTINKQIHQWYGDFSFVDEEMAEHVLRGSKSFAARSLRSRISNSHTSSSLRVPSNASQNENFSGQDSMRPTSASMTSGGSVLGEIAPNNQIIRGGNGTFKLRPSPTPSLKKKKAEAIVKSHGSPSHVRVTAGGRIVPSEQSPLCQPRYGYSAIKVNGGLIKFAPNLQAGKTQWTQATEDGFVAQDIDGNLCQIVNGQIMPLRQEADGGLSLYMPAPNLRITSHSIPPASVPGSNPQPAVPQPSLSAQITALDRQYAELEQDLKRLDQTEAIHGRTMTKAGKDNLVKQRRELVTNMDKIRKTLKGLRSRPPPNAPTSPRAMQKRQSISPQCNAPFAPVVHGQRGNMPPQGFGTGPFFAAPQAALDAGNALYSSAPADDGYSGHHWAVPPASVFLPQPPPFDGSMAQPMSGFQSGLPSTFDGPLPATIGGRIPQNDGAHSVTDIELPRPAQPISIKVPDTKNPSNFKSVLNPMSPAYKPGKVPGSTMNNAGVNTVSERNLTPLSPLRQFQQPSQPTAKSTNAVEDTMSPAKRNAHLHSSSISSFETADFFPRNTGEYSAHQHAYRYQEAVDGTDYNELDKRDVTPTTPAHLAWQSNATETGNTKGPAVPPSTPVYHSDATTHAPLPTRAEPDNVDKEKRDVTDRDAQNVSPKNKRQYVFVHENPGAASKGLVSSSPANAHGFQEDIHEPLVETVNFAEKSRNWLMGYQAGLRGRSAPASSDFDFLDGMCSGYLALKKASEAAEPGQSNGSPLKTHSRRPSPAIPSRASSRLHPTSRPPFIETTTQSIDCLKQAVFSEKNENAILTPAVDGPHIKDAPTNLGAWAKNTHNAPSEAPAAATGANLLPGFPFPKRGGSAVDCQSDRTESGNMTSKACSDDREREPLLPNCNQLPLPVSPTTSTKSIASSSIAGGVPTPTDARIASLSSIDSNMYRQWPGNRIMTPGEWRSARIAAQPAGLTTGYFAHGQFDGTSDQPNFLRMPGQLTMGIPGAPQRVGSVTSMETVSQVPAGGRFREGSLDSITNPPNSPPPMCSTSASTRENSKRNKDGNSRKNGSPTKAKFESLAEKVGIKVSGADNNDGASDPVSPSGKRQWRDVWHKGGKDGNF